MLTNRGALGALAIVGIVAAGGGAYFAGRQHPVPETQAISSHDVTLPAAPGAVTETENSLAPAPGPLTNVQPQGAPVAAAPVRPANSQTASSARPPANRPAAQRSQSARPSYSPRSPATNSASVPGKSAHDRRGGAGGVDDR